MLTPLLDSLRSHLLGRLVGHGFEPRDLKISRAARSLGRVGKTGFSIARTAEDDVTEFLHFQRGADVHAITGLVGWTPGDTIAWGDSVVDWPDEVRTESRRKQYCCPLFTLFETDGARAHARRLEGDDWWLVSPGAVPSGLSDEALAQGIGAVMTAQRESARALAGGISPSLLLPLADRIVQDIERLALPCFAARARHAP